MEILEPGEKVDFYGSGERLHRFEETMARTLGHEAAVFMPSGTMAQQIALRIVADRRDCKRVAFHCTSHLEIHEQGAYRELHGLEAQLLGAADRLFTLAELEALDLPLSTILWELPQREIGGQLPSWDDLQAQLEWAAGQGIHRHLDGARLWEAAPYYERSPGQIAGAFDSMYVSFYKGIGGIAGAVLAGDQSFIEASRVWLRRHGGNLVSLYPYVLSAEHHYRKRAHCFGDYAKRAASVARTLGGIDGITVVPTQPPTCMMHLHFDAEADTINERHHALAAEHRVQLFSRAVPLDNGGCKVELSIGDAIGEISDDELGQWYRLLVSP